MFSDSFIAGDDEDVRFDVSINPANTLAINVRFVASDAKEAKGSWILEAGVLQVRFEGWKNPLGTSLVAPQRIGDINGEVLWFQMAHHRTGEVNVAHFIMLVGGASV